MKHLDVKIDRKILEYDVKDYWNKNFSNGWVSWIDYGLIDSSFKKYKMHNKTQKPINSRKGEWKKWDELTESQKTKLYFILFERFGDRSIKFESHRIRWYDSVLFYEKLLKFNHMRFWSTLSQLVLNNTHFIVIDSLQTQRISSRINLIFDKIKHKQKEVFISRNKNGFWKFPHFVYYKVNFYDQTVDNIIGRIWCFPFSLFTSTVLSTKLSLELHPNPSKILHNVFCPREHDEEFKRLTAFEILTNKQLCLQLKLIQNASFYKKQHIKIPYYSKIKSAHSKQNFYKITTHRGKLFGLSQKQYASKLFSWSRKIKMEYDNLCQICLKPAHASHHLLYAGLYPKLSLNINNGIPLCHLCHQQTHGKKLTVVTS